MRVRRRNGLKELPRMYVVTEEQLAELMNVKARLDNFMTPDRMARILATDTLGEIITAIERQLRELPPGTAKPAKSHLAPARPLPLKEDSVAEAVEQ